MAKENFDRSKPHLNIGTLVTLITVKLHLTAAITKVMAEKGFAQKLVLLIKLITLLKKKSVVLLLTLHT